MSGVYEAYLIRMLAPLGLYDLNGVQNRSELSALGGKLDEPSSLQALLKFRKDHSDPI